MPAQAALQVGSARVSNVFDPSEIPSLPVTAQGTAIDWTLFDAGGRSIGSGKAPITDGRAEIRLPQPGRGYFEVALKSSNGESGRAAFAVVPARRTRPANSPFGVMTHFAQGWDPALIDTVARMGLWHVRDEQYWQSVEKQPGQYNYIPRFTAYMDALKTANIEPLLEATFANTNYDGGKTPYTDQGRRAYSNYAVDLIRRYPGQTQALEIWNEYNGSFCDGPACADRPASYTALLRDAYTAIKQKAPKTTVIGGAAVLIPPPYLKGVFRAGGLQAMDVLAIHPYRTTPEGVEEDIAALRQSMRDAGGEKPIWATEAGWGTPRADRFEVARYLVRIMTLLRAAGVERVYWYLLRDYENFVGMGLLRDEGSPFGRYAPTPAYAAYATLAEKLETARFTGREKTDGRSRVYAFEAQGTPIRVAWSTGGTAKFKIQGQATVIDYLGRPVKPGPDGSVSVGTDPIYIAGSVQLAESRPDTALAISADDYSGAQGQGGWTYGRIDGDAGTTPRSLPQPGTVLARAFTPLDRINGVWSDYWGKAGYAELKVDRYDIHPSTFGGHDVWAVRRWTASGSNHVRITGTVTAANKQGDGIWAIILIDDKVVHAMAVGGANAPQTATFDVPAELASGSRVDIAITPGPAGSMNFDAASITTTITRVTP